MHFASYGAKNFAKKLLNNFFEFADYGPNHPARYVRRQAAEDTGRYVAEHMASALGFYSERELMGFALSQIPAEGECLEFGVYKGGSARFIGRTIAPRILHGFDSFEGLPENWDGSLMTAGTFNLSGKLPRVPANCKLYKGWFNDSLPKWASEYHGAVAFLHVDCDIYSSTKTIFDILGSRLIQGSVIVFDEYFNYSNWRQHEHKAFQELVASRGLAYQYIGYAHSQVAVKLTAAPA